MHNARLTYYLTSHPCACTCTCTPTHTHTLSLSVSPQHGGVRLNDYVMRINDIDCTDASFRRVIEMLKDSNVLRKTITFGSPSTFKDVIAKKQTKGMHTAFTSGGPNFISQVSAPAGV